jgi:hypothetical protein
MAALPTCSAYIAYSLPTPSPTLQPRRHSERSEESPHPQHLNVVVTWEEIGFAELRFAPVPHCVRNDGAVEE